MRARWLLIPISAYALCLCLIALWSSPVDRGVNVVELAPVTWLIDTFDLTLQQGYDITEFSANVALFVPLGLSVMLLRPTWKWWQVTILACALSTTFEILQEVLRPERFGALSDIVANTLGAMIGALVCVAARSGRKLLRDHRNS